MTYHMSLESIGGRGGLHRKVTENWWFSDRDEL